MKIVKRPKWGSSPFMQWNNEYIYSKTIRLLALVFYER